MEEERSVKRRPKGKCIGLTRLFWRYLLTTGVALIGVALSVLAIGLVLTGKGMVLWASAGAQAADEAVRRAQGTGVFEPETLPHYVAWARFGAGGDVIDPGTMDARQLDAARADRAGYSMRYGLFYARYHRWAQLADGSALALQYTYAMPYASVWAQKGLPDFQLTMLLALLLSALLVMMVNTGRYARILREDAERLTEATRAIADRRLDRALDARVRVRELADTLGAMDELRSSLAASLEREWGMEQQRGRTFSALAHDLKTPLTIVSGHAQLLEEDELTPEQRESVRAIARGAEQIQVYLAQLRELAVQMSGIEPLRKQTDLSALLSDLSRDAQALCALRHIGFNVRVAIGLEGLVEGEMIRRAVLNLLDNAVRVTPKGGCVTLEAEEEDGLLKVRVSDTGPGFSKEALHRAGQVFYTGESGRPQDGHAGFGLFWCAQVAARHGGSLSLRNGEQGAVVSMTFLLR